MTAGYTRTRKGICRYRSRKNARVVLCGRRGAARSVGRWIRPQDASHHHVTCRGQASDRAAHRRGHGRQRLTTPRQISHLRLCRTTKAAGSGSFAAPSGDTSRGSLAVRGPFRITHVLSRADAPPGRRRSTGCPDRHASSGEGWVAPAPRPTPAQSTLGDRPDASSSRSALWAQRQPTIAAVRSRLRPPTGVSEPPGRPALSERPD